MRDIGILILGHGSTLPYNKELIEATAKMIGKKHPGPVRIAFLNANEPHIPEGLQSFSGTQAKKIVALPLFLAHGVHTKVDIPHELGLDKGSTKGTANIGGVDMEVFCAEPLGADECIANLAYQRAVEALE